MHRNICRMQKHSNMTRVIVACVKLSMIKHKKAHRSLTMHYYYILWKYCGPQSVFIDEWRMQIWTHQTYQFIETEKSIIAFRQNWGKNWMDFSSCGELFITRKKIDFRLRKKYTEYFNWNGNLSVSSLCWN